MEGSTRMSLTMQDKGCHPHKVSVLYWQTGGEELVGLRRISLVKGCCSKLYSTAVRRL